MNGYGYVHGAGDASVVGGNWHSDLGSLSKISLKPKPLEPIHSLREKFFESARRNDSLRSDSQSQGPSGGSTEEESEPEQEKTEPKTHNNENVKQNRGVPTTSQQRNQNTRKPPMAPRPNHNSTTGSNANTGGWNGGGYPSQDVVSVRRQTEMLVHGRSSRDYQVYHSRVEIDPSSLSIQQQQRPPDKGSSSPISPTTPINSANKRVDVDSAGSNHTRDSGVSVGSVGGTKTVSFSPPEHSSNY